jgi:hypothetical protein
LVGNENGCNQHTGHSVSDGVGERKPAQRGQPRPATVRAQTGKPRAYGSTDGAGGEQSSAGSA